MRKLFGILTVAAAAVTIMIRPVPVLADEFLPQAQTSSAEELAAQNAQLLQMVQAAQAAQQAQLAQLAQQAEAAKKAQEAQAAKAAQEAQKAQAAQAAAALKAAQEMQAAQAAQLAAQTPVVPAEAAPVEGVGSTYVDVNLASQTLTYFVNGSPALSTPCVTGSPGRSTPTGVFAINSKVPGKYLTGPTWHVWVNRWMRFTGNVGIHDASWRKSFGGNIYRSNGSHGCVNIPHAAADQLYNMVGLGTVVVVH